MFDLEEAIADWRDRIRELDALDGDLIRELESHLRDAHDAAVASGAEALKYLDDGHEVDVVLTDVMMPGGIDGFELTLLLRFKGLEGLRVYGVSALTDKQYREKGERVGMDGFITKPVSLSALGAVLDK